MAIIQKVAMIDKVAAVAAINEVSDQISKHEKKPVGICYYCHVIVESRNRSHFCMHHWKILPKRYPIFIVVFVVFSYFCKRVCPCVGFTKISNLRKYFF